MALALISQDAGMMELIRSRLANDERPLKRTLKAFYKLAEPSTDDDVADQVGRCQAEFLLELRGLARTLETAKGTRIVGMTEKELDGLRAEKRKVEEETEEQSKKIRLLEGELEQARQERREKLEYEEVGREVRRFGDRLQSAECVPQLKTSFEPDTDPRRMAGLSKEIQGLLEEQESYSQRWASRQTQFDLVVKNLLSLQESIRSVPRLVESPPLRELTTDVPSAERRRRKGIGKRRSGTTDRTTTTRRRNPAPAPTPRSATRRPAPCPAPPVPASSAWTLRRPRSDRRRR